MGRKKLTEGATKVIPVKVAVDRLSDWNAAAKEAGVSRAEWIRTTVEAALKR
jgi:hypothetical protein